MKEKVPRGSLITSGSSSSWLCVPLEKESEPRGSKGISCSLWEAHTCHFGAPSKGGQTWGMVQSVETRKDPERSVKCGDIVARPFPCARWSGQPGVGLEYRSNKTATALKYPGYGFCP